MSQISVFQARATELDHPFFTLQEHLKQCLPAVCPRCLFVMQVFTLLTWFGKDCYSVSSHSNAYSRDTIDVYLSCKYAFITWFDSHCYPTSGSGHVHSQHAENVYLPGEHLLTSRFDGNIYFTSSSGSVCFKHAEKKSTFHVGSPLLLGLIVIVTL